MFPVAVARSTSRSSAFGSFFIFPEVPGGNDLEFCERALANKLVVVPGRAFSSRTGHVRISFAVSDETLERGIEVLSRLIERGD